MLKKALFPALLVLTIVLAPVLAMSVSPTRSLLLGLAPEEAVLTLADQLDKNRIETEAKVTELQAVVEAQNQSISGYELKIAEQEGRLSEQEKMLNTQGATVASQAQTQQSLSTKVATQAKCQQLYSENIYCGNKTYKTKSAFDDYIDDLKDREDEDDNDYVDVDYDEMIDKAKEKFKKCQEIVQICGY